MSAPLTPLRIGFMPLTDAAILLAAATQGFAEGHGLALELVRETSWANIRDRLAIGHFDAAHMLAPMPVAANLGLTPLDVPLIAPMALGIGGNAVTFSAELWAEITLGHRGEQLVGQPARLGAALADVVAHRRQRGAKPLVFGVVHPVSAHNYELRYFLSAAGIQPDSDVDIAILPPPLMADALAAGRIDGFCVGEPWNTVAAHHSGGRIVLTKGDIWRASPEKVLGLRADWAAENPSIVEALLHALLDAAEWCGDQTNYPTLLDMLAAPSALNRPQADIAPGLSGALPMADGTLRRPGGFLEFSRDCANFPWASHALWFAAQMQRWGQMGKTQPVRARALSAFRPDIFRRVAAQRGLNAPLVDFRPESIGQGRIQVAGSLGPLDLPAGGLFDDAPFSGDMLP